MDFEIRDGEPELGRVRSRRGEGMAVPLARAIDKLGVGQWIEAEKKYQFTAGFVVMVIEAISPKKYSKQASANPGMIIVRRTE